MNIQEENSTRYFRVQSEREQTLVILNMYQCSHLKRNRAALRRAMLASNTKILIGVFSTISIIIEKVSW